jgi:hypothetical protein
VKSGVRIFTRARFIVIVCATLFCCSQAIADGEFDVSSETSVTGGTIVRKENASTITIKELDTNKLIRFVFIEGEASVVVVQGSSDYAPATKVIVDDQPATPHKLKVGMRAQVVFYTYTDEMNGEKTNFIKSVKAISPGKQKPAK